MSVSLGNAFCHRCLFVSFLKMFYFIKKDRWAGMIGVAVQNALAASLLAPHGPGMVLEQPAAPAPELDILLDGQRWAFEEPFVGFD